MFRTGLGSLAKFFSAPAANNGVSQICVRSVSTFQIQDRLVLNNLRNNPKHKEKRMRIGRGIGSGKGKTAGRGHKGATSRSGNEHGPEFEGGQTPIHRRFPKRGFTNFHSVDLEPMNLTKLTTFIEKEKLSTDGLITMRELQQSGIVGRCKDGVKLLGTGWDKFNLKVDIEVTKASKSAIYAIEKAGGSVTAKYYNRLGLRSLLKPEKFPTGLPKQALPPPRLIPYYTSKENRGYLADSDLVFTAPKSEQPKRG